MQTTLPSKAADVNRETAWKNKLTRSELSARVAETLSAHMAACSNFANAGTTIQSSFLRSTGFSLLGAWMRCLETLKIIPLDTEDQP